MGRYIPTLSRVSTEGEMQPTYPRRGPVCSTRPTGGGLFELYDKAYGGNHSNEMGMITVMMSNPAPALLVSRTFYRVQQSWHSGRPRCSFLSQLPK